MTDEVHFDVRVQAIDTETSSVTFGTVDGGTIQRQFSGRSYWKLDDVGVLHILEEGADFRFHAYPDNRLRRVPSDDTPEDGLWAWRLEGAEDVIYSIKAGIIPGKDCRVIVDDSESVSLRVPREFLDLCETYRLTPVELLQGFIADLCELQNYVVCPREDGLSSHGSDERGLANEWLQRAHAWRLDASE